MIDFLMLLACVLTRLFRSRARLEAEILVLRHHLNILQRKSTERDRKSGLQEHRSLGVYCAVSSCSWRAGCPENSQTGDGDPLAPGRIPSLLAVENQNARGPTKDSAGGSSAHSGHED